MELLKEGDTFLYQYPSNHHHLFIVITKTVTLADGKLQYICTMVSSWKERSALCDPACRLKPGEHPFIIHDSYIAYAEVIPFDERILANLLNSGKAILKEPVSPELLGKIKESAKRSKRISPMMLQYF